MTISAYVGLPGHGKSYGVVQNVIAPALKSKRTVYTNIPMVEAECIKQFGVAPIPFDTQDIIDNPQWWSEVFSAGALLVIDELWRLWPSGLKANNVRSPDKEFLAEHRHLVGENNMATEIVFVTQDLSQIASFARSLVETTYRVTKLSKLGMDKKYRVDVYFGAVTGVSPPVSKRDRTLYGAFKPEVYALYQSHTKSMTGEAGDETRTDDRFNVLKGGKVKLFFVFFLLMAFGVWKGGQYVMRDFMGDHPEPPENEPAKHQIVQATAQPSVFRFLADAEKIIISFNMGIWPNIEYQYKVVFAETEAIFSYADMQRLGYQLDPVNQCMVKISGGDFDGFAMCERDDEEKRDWVEGFVPVTNSFTN